MPWYPKMLNGDNNKIYPTGQLRELTELTHATCIQIHKTYTFSTTKGIIFTLIFIIKEVNQLPIRAEC